MDYITIAEYAKRAGISKTTAYNHAKNAKYKGYFRKVGGILQVDSSILELNQNFNLDSTIENGTDKGSGGNSFNGISTENSTVEKELISLLKERLEKADKQIEELSKQVSNLITVLQQNNLLEAGKIQVESSPEPEPIPTEKESKAEMPKKGLFSRFWKR